MLKEDEKKGKTTYIGCDKTFDKSYEMNDWKTNKNCEFYEMYS